MRGNRWGVNYSHKTNKDLRNGEPHVQHILSASRIGDNGADTELG